MGLMKVQKLQAFYYNNNVVYMKGIFKILPNQLLTFLE